MCLTNPGRADDYGTSSAAGAMAQMMVLMMEAMSEVMRQRGSSRYGGDDYLWPPPGYAPPMPAPPYAYPYGPTYEYPPEPPAYPTSVLEGTWMGRNGDYLVVHGVEFHLFASPEHVIGGLFRIEGDSLALMNTETGITRLYEYAMQEGRLVLRDRDGQILLYKRISRYPFPDPYSVH